MLLNPNEMHQLIYEPLGKDSLLTFNSKMSHESIKDLILIRFHKQVLTDIQAAKAIKLTAKGNFPRKFVHQLYNHKIYTSPHIDDGTIKLLREDDFTPIHLAHVWLKMAGLIRKYNNKISVTKKGEKALLNENQIYHHVLKMFLTKFAWNYLSYCEDKVGQLGWGYLMYLLVKFGDEEREMSFYLEHYLEYFSELVYEMPNTPNYPQIERFESNFKHIFFHRFCATFGLVELRSVKGEKDILEQELWIKKTPLCDHVFQIKESNPTPSFIFNLN